MKLVILDRDGVINEDSDDYIKKPSEWIPIPGSLEAISALNAAGWTVSIATNQSGLARGLFDSSTLHAIHQTMNLWLDRYNAKVDHIVWCPHGPNDLCQCRKPKPGMYRHIASHFNTVLHQVPVIGDSKRDLDAAFAVGAQPILVQSGKGKRTIAAGQLPKGTLIYSDLRAAVKSLLSLENNI